LRDENYYANKNPGGRGLSSGWGRSSGTDYSLCRSIAAWSTPLDVWVVSPEYRVTARIRGRYLPFMKRIEFYWGNELSLARISNIVKVSVKDKHFIRHGGIILSLPLNDSHGCFSKDLIILYMNIPWFWLN
jgi:hypothetical protein